MDRGSSRLCGLFSGSHPDSPTPHVQAWEEVADPKLSVGKQVLHLPATPTPLPRLWAWHLGPDFSRRVSPIPHTHLDISRWRKGQVLQGRGCRWRFQVWLWALLAQGPAILTGCLSQAPRLGVRGSGRTGVRGRPSAAKAPPALVSISVP